MQVSYTTQDGKYTVTVDERETMAAFKKIAEFQEVFEQRNVTIEGVSVPTSDLQLRVRTVDGNDFPEIVYAGPDKKLLGYKLALGQSKENRGALFPKRKDADGKWLPNNGFTKWEGNKGNNNNNQSPSNDNKAPF